MSRTMDVSTVSDQQLVVAPSGAEKASVYLDRSGAAHLADVTFYPPWWHRAWVWIGAFVAGFVTASVMWRFL